MTVRRYTLFREYPFAPGDKIRIQGGKRAGDWEVTAVEGGKVTLRCPVSGRRFTWAAFCYHVEERRGPWPQE